MFFDIWNVQFICQSINLKKKIEFEFIWPGTLSTFHCPMAFADEMTLNEWWHTVWIEVTRFSNFPLTLDNFWFTTISKSHRHIGTCFTSLGSPGKHFYRADFVLNISLHYAFHKIGKKKLISIQWLGNCVNAADNFKRISRTYFASIDKIKGGGGKLLNKTD